MELQFFKPKSEVLRQYIEGYYFLTNSATGQTVNYLTFPNNSTFISFNHETEIIVSDHKVSLQENKNAPFYSDLICYYKKPLQICYEGNINEIAIAFKPLGLNAFLKDPLSQYCINFCSKFTPYDDYDDYFAAVLKEPLIEKKCDLIEKYWLSKLIGFNHPFLLQAVLDLQNIDQGYTILELAQKYNTSRQNFRNQFELHLCKSPSDFKLIHRFRLAYNLQVKRLQKETLTSLSYESLFYDQSHLIKDFKALTGFTPKVFFKNVSHLENGNINFMFL